MTEVFEAKVRRVGNSLGVIIPSEIIEEMGFRKGDIIHVAIPPSESGKRNELLKKLAGIDKEKIPFERDKGDRY
jgi:antitoxin component of MazEF toxin-antitoxin module